MLKYLAIGVRGLAGAIARYVLGSYIGQRYEVGFPYGTFVMSMTGCALLGFILVILDGRLTVSLLNIFLSVIIGFAAVGRGGTREDCRMRPQTALSLDASSIQARARGVCPICTLMRAFQNAMIDALLRFPARTLCNFHVWSLAGSSRAVEATGIFSSMLQEAAVRVATRTKSWQSSLANCNAIISAAGLCNTVQFVCFTVDG